jgi:predicted DNA-binding ribbon-helix-helix protein
MHVITASGDDLSIDPQREHGNLSSALRLFVLDHQKTAASGLPDNFARVAESFRLSPLG